MSTPALDALADELRYEIRGQRRGARISELLATYAREHDDWRAFALFEEHDYARNRVLLEDGFELLLLCWRPDDETPIHDHAGQDCWMVALDGAVEERRFAMPDPVIAEPLVTVGSTVARRGEVAFIRDEIALHLVRNAGATPASSLHLYVRPYAVCSSFDPVSGERTPRPLVDDSIRGERIPRPE